MRCKLCNPSGCSLYWVVGQLSAEELGRFELPIMGVFSAAEATQNLLSGAQRPGFLCCFVEINSMVSKTLGNPPAFQTTGACGSGIDSAC
mmetsp:Transcript_17926/g.27725  ORF Transcript_17926/g.27725 Transcript_17926/m.27725 type:complete len:90 (-) Transcript_17926:26-295(-)